MTDREHERREPSDVPGFGRVGGIDDPVSRDKYGDDPETTPGRSDPHRGIADDRRAAIHALARDGLHHLAEVLTDRDTDVEDGESR